MTVERGDVAADSCEVDDRVDNRMFEFFWRVSIDGTREFRYFDAKFFGVIVVEADLKSIYF